MRQKKKKENLKVSKELNVPAVSEKMELLPSLLQEELEEEELEEQQMKGSFFHLKTIFILLFLFFIIGSLSFCPTSNSLRYDPEA